MDYNSCASQTRPNPTLHHRVLELTCPILLFAGVSTSVIFLVLWLVSLSAGAPRILKIPNQADPAHLRHQHNMIIKNMNHVNARLSYFLKQLTKQYNETLQKLHSSCDPNGYSMKNVIEKVNVGGSTPVEKVCVLFINLTIS